MIPIRTSHTSSSIATDNRTQRPVKLAATCQLCKTLIRANDFVGLQRVIDKTPEDSLPELLSELEQYVESNNADFTSQAQCKDFFHQNRLAALEQKCRALIVANDFESLRKTIEEAPEAMVSELVSKFESCVDENLQAALQEMPADLVPATNFESEQHLGYQFTPVVRSLLRCKDFFSAVQSGKPVDLNHGAELETQILNFFEYIGQEHTPNPTPSSGKLKANESENEVSEDFSLSQYNQRRWKQLNTIAVGNFLYKIQQNNSEENCKDRNYLSEYLAHIKECDLGVINAALLADEGSKNEISGAFRIAVEAYVKEEQKAIRKAAMGFFEHIKSDNLNQVKADLNSLPPNRRAAVLLEISIQFRKTLDHSTKTCQDNRSFIHVLECCIQEGLCQAIVDDDYTVTPEIIALACEFKVGGSFSKRNLPLQLAIMCSRAEIAIKFISARMYVMDDEVMALIAQREIKFVERILPALTETDKLNLIAFMLKSSIQAEKSVQVSKRNFFLADTISKLNACANSILFEVKKSTDVIEQITNLLDECETLKCDPRLTDAVKSSIAASMQTESAPTEPMPQTWKRARPKHGTLTDSLPKKPKHQPNHTTSARGATPPVNGQPVSFSDYKEIARKRHEAQRMLQANQPDLNIANVSKVEKQAGEILTPLRNTVRGIQTLETLNANGAPRNLALMNLIIEEAKRANTGIDLPAIKKAFDKQQTGPRINEMMEALRRDDSVALTKLLDDGMDPETALSNGRDAFYYTNTGKHVYQILVDRVLRKYQDDFSGTQFIVLANLSSLYDMDAEALRISDQASESLSAQVLKILLIRIANHMLQTNPRSYTKLIVENKAVLLEDASFMRDLEAAHTNATNGLPSINTLKEWFYVDNDLAKYVLAGGQGIAYAKTLKQRLNVPDSLFTKSPNELSNEEKTKIRQLKIALYSEQLLVTMELANIDWLPEDWYAQIASQ